MSLLTRIFKAPLRVVASPKFEPLPPTLDSRRHKRYQIVMTGSIRREPWNVVPVRTVNLSASGAALASHVTPHIDEVLTVELDFMGVLPARVVRLLPHVFAVEFQVSAYRLKQLEKTVKWLAGQNLSTVRDGRRYERLVPTVREADLTVDWGQYRVRVIDISRSGIGIATDVALPNGTPVELGDNLRGMVVRQFKGGVGVDFVEVLGLDVFDEAIDLRKVAVAA